MNIVVIGAGFGGIATAIRLQASGHQVTLIDKRDKLGGRAYVYELSGFKFDGGPTIITAPWLIEELFDVSGKPMQDYVKLVQLNPFYNIRFEDGSVFHYNNDADYLIEQIRAFNPNDVAGYERFYQASQAVFNKGLPLMTKPFGNITDMVKVAPDMVELQSFKSVAGFVNQYIQDERLRQVFSFHPLLIGGNPFQSTSIYAMIHKLEQAFGIWFAMGGTGALVEGLRRLFIDIGGKVLLNTEVTEIVIDAKTKRATGVNTNNHGYIGADAVVSNADVAFTYLNLIPAKYRRKWSDKRIKSLRYSMSLFVLYFGTNRQYEHMAHHEILMGKRYRDWIEDIFTRKYLPDDFSLYLHRPTATDPSLAPSGCDCFYVLAPVPHLGGNVDWKTMAKPFRDRIVKYLEEKYLPDLSQHIVTEHYIDPLHFRFDLNSYLGSAFSIEPTLFQSAYFRPHNQSEDISNLYFVGAGTHPGAGIPGVLSSSKIVAQMISPKEG
ncbi:phytoene desaturase [Dulcicalothrix desertica PCC 7102]|uniref:Phytoene dehydrogenase n=1 Tax=Dulcicalothrix desertica PCC 7102 TaxID=232991 RepID=A0A3S1DFE3_9CYAN|nr:phytoene desaturase [Dulcicalothrix desertica]RUT08947.1 phytoene desaturase [Dulcicalothrix desertica PCC 7102]TWH49832.1 phytoene desaturase [Dulcicalothrix desertica PCC 7102]